MKINNMTEKNAGNISRKDIRRIVCQTRAPQARSLRGMDPSIGTHHEHKKDKRRPQQ
jgi:hypothetical protein